jgi:mono/diheme cytochrome c family protein
MIKRTVLVLAACLAVGLVTACESRDDDHERKGAPERHESERHERREATSAAVLERGRGIYKASCAPCHGESGKGDGPAAGGFTPAPRDHTDRAYMSKLTDTDLAQTIQYGGALKGKPMMPPSPQIKGDDLAAIVAYVRTLSAPKQAATGAAQ